MNDAVAEFLHWAEAEAGLSANTLAAYRGDLADFTSFLGKRRITKPAHVLAYLGALRRAGRAESTIARRFACLRTFFRFLNAEGLAQADPTEIIEAPRRWRTLPRVPSQDDVRLLIESIPGETLRGRRDRALFELLYTSASTTCKASIVSAPRWSATHASSSPGCPPTTRCCGARAAPESPR